MQVALRRMVMQSSLGGSCLSADCAFRTPRRSSYVHFIGSHVYSWHHFHRSINDLGVDPQTWTITTKPYTENFDMQLVGRLRGTWAEFSLQLAQGSRCEVSPASAGDRRFPCCSLSYRLRPKWIARQGSGIFSAVSHLNICGFQTPTNWTLPNS